MKIEVCLLLVVSIVRGLRRGPHHPHGQQPVEQKHHHYKPVVDTSLNKQTELLHDAKHLEEHSDILTAESLESMSPEEKEFHYFLSHDFDKNTMLDGLELLKAVYHTIDEDTDIDTPNIQFNTFVEMVDKTLSSDDMNNDGYISYPEYKAARANRTISSRAPIILANVVQNS